MSAPADLDRRDELDKLISQTAALAYLMGNARNDDVETPRTALSNAAWLADDLLERIRELALGRGNDKES